MKTTTHKAATESLESLRAAWLAAESKADDAAAASADACRATYQSLYDRLSAEKLARGRAYRASAAAKKAFCAYQEHEAAKCGS